MKRIIAGLMATAMSCMGNVSAETCPVLIFSSSFEDGQNTINTVPVDGATNVGLGDIITATFGGEIANDSVNSSTFQLSQAGTPVLSTVILDSANNKAKLGSEQTLALLTEYTATLTGCITTQSGTPLPTTSWTFTTRDGWWKDIGEDIGLPLDLGHTAPAINPHIAVSGNGDAVAVWVEETAGRGDIWSKFYNPGKGWGNPVLVETDSTYSSDKPRVAMDDAGNAIAVWQLADTGYADSIWASRYVPGSGWGEAEPLETEDGDASQQQVVASSSGNAIAVWEQYDVIDTLQIWANHYITDSGWTGPELIVWNEDTNASEPQVAINDNGVAFAVWNQLDNSFDEIPHIWANHYAPGYGWFGAELVELESSLWAYAPQVFVDATGAATVVWMQEDGSEDFLTHIWSNRYANITSLRDYYYTGTNFSVVSGGRFSASNSVTGVFRLDCGLAGGSGDCLSLPNSDYAAAVTFCSFTASGSPDLAITCDNDLSSEFTLQTNADGQITGSYNLALESSLEGGNGARIEMSDTGGATVARSGASGGVGSVTYSPGTWFLGTNYDWGTPELLETEEFTYAEDPHIAGDSNGNVIAVWQEDDDLTDSPITGQPIYNLWANRYTVGAGWSGPELVETGSDNDAFNPEIAVDRLGNANAVWETNLGGGSLISASRFVPGVGWSDAETVGWIDGSDPLDAVSTSRTPIAADDFGNMHMVWQYQQGLYPGDYPQDGIYTNRFGGGGQPNGKLVTETLFADENLADCAIAQAAANSWHFAQEVTSLSCANKDIHSLIGLETFVHLESLNLSDNPIDDISVVSRFPDLLELNLSNIPGLADIGVLLAHGQLTTIDLSGSGDGNISCPDLDALGGAVIRPAECRKTIAEVTFADSVLQTCVADSMLRQKVTFLDELTILDCGRSSGQPSIAQLDGIQILENLEVFNLDLHFDIVDYAPLADMLKLKRLDLGSAFELRTLDVIAALPNLEVLLLKSVPFLYNDFQGGQDPTGISILASMPALREVYLDEKDYCPAGAGAQCWTGRGRMDCATLDSMEGLFDVYVRPAGCNMPLADALAEVPDLALRACLQTQATNDGLTDTQGFTLFETCYNGGVTDLSGMENFSRIVHLDLRLNPITDLSPLNNIRTVQVLYLNNTNITSFDALTNLDLLRTIEARNIPGLTDISELLRMRRIGSLDGQTGVFGNVILDGSGDSNFNCDDLAALEAIITGNGATWFGVPCGGPQAPPPIPPNEGRIVDLDGDSSDDLIFQFDAGEGVPLTSNWTTALGKTPVFDPAYNLPGFDTAIYSRARAIALADANNDGVDDLLLQLDSATDDTIYLQVQLNDGSGNFTTSTTPLPIPDGALNNAQAVAFKDVNQDGFADILIQWQASLSGISFAFFDLVLGTGTSFESHDPNDYDEWIGFFDIEKKGRPRVIALEDVNNDTYPDLVYVLESIAMESDTYQKFCFDVRLYSTAANPLNPFTGSTSGANCTELKPPPRWFLDSASVADVTGNGIKDLVLSFNKEANLERTGDLIHSLSMYSLVEEGNSPKWSNYETLGGQIASTAAGVVTHYRTVAVADINNDKRADVIVEKEVEGAGKSWIAHLAGFNSEGRPEMVPDPTRIPTPSRSEEYMAIGLLDYDDTDLENLPDLLYRRMNVQSGTYEIRVAVNTGTDFDNPELWYSNTALPGIIGLEEDGLTALANDTSELIAWAGDTRLQTVKELSEYLSLEKDLELLTNTVLDTDLAVERNQCLIARGQSKASAANSRDGFSQYNAHAKFALLSCNVVTADGRLTIKSQAIYGGCAGTAGIAGIGGKCEIGLAKAEVKFNAGPPPFQPDDVAVKAKVKVASAETCAEVTLTNLCAGAEASQVDASAGLEVGGVGASAGVSAGSIGGKFQAGWEDGAITTSFGLHFGVGLEVNFSVNPGKSVDSFARLGNNAYTWGESGGEFVIYTAGPAVYDIAKDATSAVRGASGEVVEIARTGAGDAVHFFTETGAKGAFIVFRLAPGQTLEAIFAELENAGNIIAAGFKYVSGKLLSGGNTLFDAGKSLWRAISPF